MELFKAFGTLALNGAAEVKSGLSKAEARGQDFAQSMQRVGERVSGVGDKMSTWVTGPLAAATAGVAALTNKATNVAQGIRNQARLSGEGVEKFQELAFAAKTVGIEQEKLGDIFKDVQDKVGDFNANQAGPLKDFFENIAPQVGVTAENFRNLSGRDALQLYVDSLEKANVSQDQMTFYMEAIASDASKLLPLLKNGGERMRQLGDEAREAGLVLSKETIASVNKAEGDMAKFGTAVDVVATQLGAALIPVMEALVPVLVDVVVPAFKTLAGVLKGVATGFAALPAPIQQILTLLVSAVAVLGPVLSIVGRMIALFGRLRLVVAAVGAVLKGGLLAALIPFAGPVLAVVAAVVALVGAFKGLNAAFRLLEQKLPALRQMWNSVTQSIRSTIASWFNAVVNLFARLGTRIGSATANAVRAVVATFRQLPGQVAALFSNLVQRTTALVSGWASNVVGVVQGLATSMGKLVAGAVSGVVELFSQLPQQVVSLLSGMATSAQNVVSTWATSMASAIQQMGSSMVSTMGDTVRGIVNWVSQLPSRVIGIVTDMVNSVISRVRQMYQEIVGNSIVPDMVMEVGQEFQGMRKQGSHETAGMVDEVQKSMSSLNGPDLQGKVQRSTDQQGAGGEVRVDMRHAVIRDDRDLSDRLTRSGVQTAGVF